MRFSSHSGRVWAIVLLHKAGMNPDFIKSQLHWMGDSYRLYLLDTATLQRKHITALDKASEEFVTLFGENQTTLPDFVPLEDNMGQYNHWMYILLFHFMIYFIIIYFLFLHACNT